ncbi:MAG: hypothetical protein LUD47_07135 [Clostridia bacterium]|nr:hypothetical protein [Clostridia bacterium]
MNKGGREQVSLKARIKRIENAVRKQMKLLDAMNEYLGKVKKTDAKVCCALVATTDAAMTGDKLPDSRNYRLVAPRADFRLFQT